VPYKISVSLVGDGEGKARIKVPDFLSLSAPDLQEFEVPAEVSWYIITTKERYGAYEITLDVMYDDVSIFEKPLRIPLLSRTLWPKRKGAWTS